MNEIIVHQRLTVPRNGIAERAVRRVTSAILLQPGLDEKWWADLMERCSNLRNVQDLLPDRKTLNKGRFGEPSCGPIIPFGSMVEYHPISAKDWSRLHQFGKKLPGIFIGYVLYAEASRKKISWSWTLRTGKFGHVRKPRSETECERGSDANKNGDIIILSLSQMEQSCWQEEIRNSEHPH